MQLADRVRDAVAATAIDTGTNQVHVTVSVGVARSTPTMTAQELLSQADGALHLAKMRGRNCAQLADSQMIESSLARIKLIHQLHEGLARDEFAPWFQPIVDFSTGMTVGYEVLARWEQPDLVTDAGGFIDAAEDSGLIIPIGNRVISTAIEIYANEDCGGTLSINASPVQLRDPDFATRVLTKLAEGRIPTSKVTLEITEQSLLVNEAPIISNLQTLHANHVALYVDDFGTGYSSLTTLRDYPISGIKLDKSFSQRLVAAPYGSIANLIRGLSELANNLRLDRIAEGIENEACAQRVHELGWQRGQGYFFGHARPSTSQNAPQSRARRRRGRAGLEVVDQWAGPSIVPDNSSTAIARGDQTPNERRVSDRPA
jgi:EAL domain-containing protein (putative c-di-GMP-specific phosphodiesterase class I)